MIKIIRFFLTVLFLLAGVSCSKSVSHSTSSKELALTVLGVGKEGNSLHTNMPNRVAAAEILASRKDAGAWIGLILQTRVGWRSQVEGYKPIAERLKKGEIGLIVVLLESLPDDTEVALLLPVVELLENHESGEYSRCDSNGMFTEIVADCKTGPVSDHAEKTLVRCTGKNFGKNVKAWQEYLLRY